MRYQIVSDSSSNVFHLEGVSYTTVPMKIIMGEKEFVDTERLNVRGMACVSQGYPLPLDERVGGTFVLRGQSVPARSDPLPLRKEGLFVAFSCP